MISRPVFSRRFIGRRAQLDALLQRFQDAVEGKGSVVVVGGEAGMGKTRLLEEYARRVAEQHGLCATGSCLEYAQSPFAPFVDALRALMRSSPQGLTKDPVTRANLARLLPELGQSDAERFGGIEEERRAQFEAIADALGSFARSSPLVIIVEDLHWADKASLDLVQYMLGRIATSRLVLVGSCRIEDLHGKHPARSALARFERSKYYWKIELDPLRDSDIHALIDNALEGRTPPPPETVASICRLAEGNPLFAEELLKSALEPGDMDGAGVLPLTITQAVVERTSRFDPRARSVLTTAAALGRRFGADMLSELTAQPLDELFAIMKHAREVQLIVEEPDGDSTMYAFRHALMQEAIYSELLAAEARPLHARIAAIIEGMPDSGKRVAELAYHCWVARDYQKAERYNESAAEAASKVYAFADAAVFYERAIAAAEHLGVVRPELLTKLGGALLYTGSGERSHKAYLRALEHYERSGSVEDVAETCVGYARMCFNLGDLRMAAAMAEKASSLLGEDSDASTYFSAQVMLSYISFRENDAERALQQLDRADRFKGERKPQDEIAFYNHRAFAHNLQGDVDAVMQDLQAAVGAAKRAGNVPYQVTLLGNMALILSYFGQRERSEACAEEGSSIALARGVHGFFQVCFLMQYALLSLNFGRLEKAKELVEQVLASGIQAAEVQIDTASMGMTVAIKLEDEILLERCARIDLLEKAFEAKARRQIASIAKGFVEYYVARHEAEKARHLLHRVVATIETLPDETEEEILPYIAAYGADDDIGTARSLLERYVSHVKRPDARGQALLFEAFAARRAGHKDEAKEWAEKAAALYRDLKRPNHEALALELAERPEEALALYRETGNLRDAHRLESTLSPRNRRGRSKDELTQREQQVVALIVEGKTNRTIAEALVLSERTVETHVASIFQKMGVNSRIELVARSARSDARPRSD